MMKSTEFKVWMKSIERMSRNQREKQRKRLEGKDNADEIIALIERSQKDKPACPYCEATELYRWGKASNTSFKWRHRFLQIPATHQPSKMNGIVEADEAYFLESFKGQRRLPRSARKRGGKAVKKGTSKEQVPVLVVRDRHGETADCILHGTSTQQIEPVLIPLLNKDVILCTDGMPAYKQIAQQANIVHRPVNIAAGQRVVNNIYHIQNVNAYDSQLKQWMKKFHGVATRYLESYLGWHRMIDRLGQNITPTLCFFASLGKTRQFQQLTLT